MPEKKAVIPMTVVRRLPRYYRFFCELRDEGVSRISSRGLSERMGLTASQIRQDLNYVGEVGQQGYGYPVERLCDELRAILGFHTIHRTILIGAGNLGHAVANHMDFDGKGLPLVGIFDDAPHLVGTQMHGITVRSTAELTAFCEKEKPTVAVLCIPKEAAEVLSEQLITLGIRAFWNFSHYDISVAHPEVAVENVHLGDSLMTLSYLLEHS